MAFELVFSVDGPMADPARPISLADAGLRERRDLQEWVIAHPEILGSGVKVITFEFGQWQARAGGREFDRLDVLGLETEGRLVVAELKRDHAPDTVEMQAIKYAAMASRFTETTLVEQYHRFRRSADDLIDEDSTRDELVDHAGELDLEQLRRPRIVLVAGSFPPVVTASVVWLTEMGLDITLQRVQAYRVFDDRTIITVSQLYPVPDAEEFTVSPLRAEARAATERQRRKRDGSSVVRLIRSGEIEDGTPLTLQPVGVNESVRAAIEQWIADDPRRGQARWFNSRREPLEWAATGERSRPTPIVQSILAQVGVEQTARGPAWWHLPDGRDLATAASQVTSPSQLFDWSGLHALLAAIPAGRWTTYGDLAAVVGTAPQPVGTHISTCAECPNAQRVLGADGRPRDEFSWGDLSDTRSQADALAEDGVRFNNGVADPSQRMGVDELEQLLT
jgi:alkylated DNA nucleotide flippase Atl1